MRLRGAFLASGTSLVLAAAAALRAEDPTPAPLVPWTCTQPEIPPLPSQPTGRDLRDQGLRGRLRAIHCALDARRHFVPEGPQSCYFGPEYARISNERYEAIRQAHLSDPVELWHALLSEPEDPNLPPLEIRVTSKSGPNCNTDYDREFESEADAIQKELNVR